MTDLPPVGSREDSSAATARVAALFVEKGGAYFGLDGVDPWDEARDARLYEGPWPVVAHPPCNVWCQLAPVNEARYGKPVGHDGGCFAAALEAVESFGGVLEHPAYTLAWHAFDLPRPRRGSWQPGGCGWVTEVSQSAYGSPARKRTWLYYVGSEPPALDWDDPAGEAVIGGGINSGECAGRRKIEKREASATPAEFRDLLLSIARSSVPSGGRSMTDQRSAASGRRPRLLDLFCGAGGCSVGYERAGFEVVGVDIAPQPNYPFEFYQEDALRFLNGWAGWGPFKFDAIHASPPCQRWAAITVKGRENHPDLIAPLRPLLEATGLPWVIENVPAAPLIDPVMVCGGALGCVSGDLQLHRHRMFEASFPIVGTPCVTVRPQTVSVVGHGSPTGNRGTLGRNPTIAEKREAMGIDWCNRDELSEAVPPAYTEWIGNQLLEQVRNHGKVAA